MYSEALIQEAAARLKAAAPEGSKVILFGSYARGDARPTSDLDFLIVEPQVKSKLAEMVRLRRELRPLRVRADVVVASGEQFDYWKDTPCTVFYEASKEGRLLG